MTSGALWLWVSQLATLISGFVLPSLMNRQLGTEALGAWDLAWSFVSFMALLNIGVGPSSNRFMALHQELGELDELDKTISSIFWFQVIVGVVSFLLMTFIGLNIDSIVTLEAPELKREITMVFLIFGLCVLVRTVSGAFDGMMTAVGRWDLLSVLRTVVDFSYVGSAAISLYLGYGLVHLAWLYLLFSCVLVAGSVIISLRVFDVRGTSFRRFNLLKLRTLIGFSSKSYLLQFSGLAYNQVAFLLIGIHGGIAMLPLFVRPTNLLMTVRSSLSKVGNVATPVISRMLANSDFDGIRMVVIRNLNVTFPLAISGAIVFAVFGPDVMLAWMGPGFDDLTILSILALSFAMSGSMNPLYGFLIAMNRHGVAGACRLGLAVSCSITLWVLIELDYPVLLSAAWAGVPIALVADVLLLSWFTNQVLGGGLMRVYLKVLQHNALLIALVALACLALDHWVAGIWWRVAAGGVVSGFAGLFVVLRAIRAEKVQAEAA